MPKRIKIVVLMGGKSSEHDISIISGKEIIENLDRKKYIVKQLIISKRGEGINKITQMHPDLVFIALHGKGGEDGTIQGYLESLNIPYTGSGVLASAIGMDKVVFRQLMQINNISTPDSCILYDMNRKTQLKFSMPCFVKPFDGGSSIGVSFVERKKDLKRAVGLAFRYSDKVIIEKYIKGLEINCGVIGNDNPKALPLIEIHPTTSKFFDYKSKYTKGASEEIVPARISISLTKKIRELSLKIYKIVGCRGYARIDYILENGKNPVVLEINTLPGMTPNSLLPKEAMAEGITYPKLLDMIINLAVVK